MKKLFIIVLMLLGTHLYGMGLIERVSAPFQFKHLETQYQRLIDTYLEAKTAGDKERLKHLKVQALNLTKTIEAFKLRSDTSYETQCNYMERMLLKGVDDYVHSWQRAFFIKIDLLDAKFMASMDYYIHDVLLRNGNQDVAYWINLTEEGMRRRGELT